MKGMRLNTLLIVVLVIALMLGVGIGLKRWAWRFDRLSLAESGKAGGQESGLLNAPTPSEVKRILRETHWHDAIASKYRRHVERPWLLSEPDPATIALRVLRLPGPISGRPPDRFALTKTA